MSVVKIFITIFALSIYIYVGAQSSDKLGQLMMTYNPLSIKLANLDNRYSSNDSPENFEINHYNSLTPEFSLTYISPLEFKNFQFGLSFGHKTDRIKYDVTLRSEFIGSRVIWNYKKEFKYDILYLRPIFYRRINNKSALQLGMEIGRTYRVDGFIESYEENTYLLHSVRNSEFEVVHRAQYRIERNNPFYKSNLIQFSSPEISYYRNIFSGLSFHLGMKLNLGFMGGGRFLHFYKYNFESRDYELLYYASAKKTMTGTVGLSYNLNGLRKKSE